MMQVMLPVPQTDLVTAEKLEKAAAEMRVSVAIR
jgi:hypothetical protein